MELIKIYEGARDYVGSTLVETGGIQQLHEGRDSRGKWRRMLPFPFRILMRMRASEIEISDLSIRKWNFEARESKRREKIERRIEREKKSSSQNFSFLSPLKNKQTDNCWKSSPSNFYPTARITFYVFEQSEKEYVARGELFSSLFLRLRSSLRSLITTFLWQRRGTILPSLPSSLLHLFSRAADTLNVDIHWRNVYVTSRTNKRANKRNEFEIEFTEFQILLR